MNESSSRITAMSHTRGLRAVASAVMVALLFAMVSSLWQTADAATADAASSASATRVLLPTTAGSCDLTLSVDQSGVTATPNSTGCTTTVKVAAVRAVNTATGWKITGVSNISTLTDQRSIASVTGYQPGEVMFGVAIFNYSGDAWSWPVVLGHYALT